MSIFACRSRSKGFYLIHAPRAFYIISMRFLAQPPPSFKVFTCTVAFDPKRFQFFCPGTDLRWNRVGRPIGAHAGSSPYGALRLLVATVAQDGHILYMGGNTFGSIKGNPWG